jgi:predicted transcriptional regulator
MTVTATMEEQTTIERLLGTVGEAMTRDVVLLAADMTAVTALRRLDVKAVSGPPVVDQAGRSLGVLARDDVLGAVAGCSWDRQGQPQAREASL